jgi:hypothetical protein
MLRLGSQLILLCLCLTACGPSRPEVLVIQESETTGINQNPAPPQFKVSSDWIPEKIDLRCAGNYCPPAVGLLLFAIPAKSGFEVARCTASLIAPDMILSNGHCDRLPADGYFVLPGRNRVSRVKRTVSKIWSVEKGVDVAIFQLEQEVRDATPLKMASGKQANYPSLVAYVVNPRGAEDFAFQIDRLTCDFKFHARDFPYRINESPNVLAGVGCEAKRGNSGSPFINPLTGSIEAVLQSKAGGDGKLTYATNLRCVTVLKQDPLDCVSVTDAETNVRFVTAQRQAFERLKSIAPSQADDRLEYQAYPFQLLGSTQDFEVLYMPKCRHRREQLAELRFPSEHLKMTYSNSGEIDWQKSNLRWNKAQVESTDQAIAILSNTQWAEAFGRLRSEDSHPRSSWGPRFPIDLPQCSR